MRRRRGVTPEAGRDASGWARRGVRRHTLTTGQVMVRVIPSICWRSRTTNRPSSSMEAASVLAITS